MGLLSTQRALPILLLCAAAGSAAAGTITCVPAAPAGGGARLFQPIRKLSIDEHARTVNMDVVRARTKEAETMGKVRGELLGMEENQSGEPVYVFNAIPAEGARVLSLYRLSKAADWHLIGADVSFAGKMPALRSVEPGVVLDCRRSDLG